MMPPQRVLTAIDFSEASRTALSCAARLARSTNAELHVAHVEEPLLAAAALNRGLDLASDVRQELHRFLEATSPAAASRVRFHVVAGETVPCLLDIAHREHIDVIVVGARGATGIGKLVFGSVSEGLLRHADVSVLVVPHPWSPAAPDSADLTGIGPIICGVDLTLPSMEAAQSGARLAALLGSEAILLHVVPAVRRVPRWLSHAEQATQSRLEVARQELNRIAAALATDRHVRLQVDVGDVPECLAAATERAPHAILVLGRALREGGYAPPGANAYRAMTLARVPVLMHVTRE